MSRYRSTRRITVAMLVFTGLALVYFLLLPFLFTVDRSNVVQTIITLLVGEVACVIMIVWLIQDIRRLNRMLK